MSTIIPFGVLPGGEEVSLIRLKGNGAVQAEIITLGAIIKSLWVPDRKDDRKDVVLGQDSLEAYLNNQSCSAAVIGRVANRIGGASFSIVKEKYQLEANDRWQLSPQWQRKLRCTEFSGGGDQGRQGTLVFGGLWKGRISRHGTGNGGISNSGCCIGDHLHGKAVSRHAY